jgi:hypothetical protein
VGNDATDETDPSGQESAVKKDEIKDNSGKFKLIVYKKDDENGDYYGVLERDGKKQFFGHCVHSPATNLPLAVRKDPKNPKSDYKYVVWWNIGFKDDAARQAFEGELQGITNRMNLSDSEKEKQVEALINKYKNNRQLMSYQPNCPAVYKYMFSMEKNPFTGKYKDGDTWPKNNKGKELQRFPDGYLSPQLVKP